MLTPGLTKPSSRSPSSSAHSPSKAWESDRELVDQILAGDVALDQAAEAFAGVLVDDGGDLDRAVEIITSDKKLWVNTMLTEEYGLPMSDRSPLKAAVGTFIAFMLCGLVPLLPFFLRDGVITRVDATWWSVALTGAIFFGIASLKSRWSLVVWWHSGVETTLIGLGAALIAFGIGFGLKSFI